MPFFIVNGSSLHQTRTKQASKHQAKLMFEEKVFALKILKTILSKLGKLNFAKV